MIDENIIIKNLRDELEQLWDDYNCLRLENRNLENEVERLNKLMPAPVIYEKDVDYELYTCSKCGHQLVGIAEDNGEALDDKPNFCPKCGGDIVYVIKIDTNK